MHTRIYVHTYLHNYAPAHSMEKTGDGARRRNGNLSLGCLAGLARVGPCRGKA